MSQKSNAGDSVYKVVEPVGTSTQSWEDAPKRAAKAATDTIAE